MANTAGDSVRAALGDRKGPKRISRGILQTELPASCRRSVRGGAQPVQMRRSPIKKVRKSLALDIVDEDVKLMMSTLPKPTNILTAGSSCLTPSGSRENSSLLNEGFLQAKPEKPAAPKPRGHFPTPAPMTSAWKTVACGGTRDQLFMQEKARQLLGRLKPSHTSRTLILS